MGLGAFRINSVGRLGHLGRSPQGIPQIMGAHFVTRLPLIFLKMDMTSVLCRNPSDTKMCERR